MTIHKLFAAAILMAVAVSGWSQTSPDEHAGHHPPKTPQETAPSTMVTGSGQATLKTANDMTQLRGLIEKAEHTKSAAERERLLAEHLAAMRRQLDALKAEECGMEKMAGPAMSGSPADGRKHGKADGGMMMDGGMKDEHMTMCHEMMKARMAMIADLLEQTWRREELRQKVAN